VRGLIQDGCDAESAHGQWRIDEESLSCHPVFARGLLEENRIAQQVRLFIQAARATDEDIVETEQRARSTRNFLFVITIPTSLILGGLFIVSLIRAWQIAIWEPTIIAGSILSVILWMLMRVVQRVRFPLQSQLDDIRMIQGALASSGVSDRGVVAAGGNSDSSTKGENIASQFRIQSLSVSSDRTFALTLFRQCALIVILSILVAIPFLYLLTDGGLTPEFWQAAWRDGAGPMFVGWPLGALLFPLYLRVAALPSVSVSRAIGEANNLLKGAMAEADSAGIRWTGGYWGKRSFWAAWGDVASIYVVRATAHRAGRDGDL
jgi:hypothetical protein